MAMPLDDPFSAVLTGGAGPMLNGGSAAPSGAKSGTLGGSMFNADNWNVNFGSGSITSSANKGELAKYMPYIVVGVAGLLAWRYLKKH